MVIVALLALWLVASASKLIPINDAAEYLGTSVHHLRRLVQERRIPFARVGGKVRFDLDDLDGWIESNKVHPATEHPMLTKRRKAS